MTNTFQHACLFANVCILLTIEQSTSYHRCKNLANSCSQRDRLQLIWVRQRRINWNENVEIIRNERRLQTGSTPRTAY